ncbi:uncharacterized protein LOC118742627 [Rhagoletis pomonella]|uniref:uncharacterized protein LOC118742627 n=1 Tax=Rhagoletis pomonella TaxID=28610 RepID=UPI001787143A|nr:uncharacterized protein LOC118742627 [Rhagoletis pomonella]
MEYLLLFTFIKMITNNIIITPRSKTTNKHQIELLLSRMQAHPDIARGFFKGQKDDVNKFWRQVEEDLNSAGPPMKNVCEWKKVWADQKKYVRRKAAQNLKASKGTGGGPNMEQKLSPTEEAIYELVGMKESVEGVSNTLKFGLSSHVTKSPADNSTAENDILDSTIEELEEVTPYQPPTKKKRNTPQGEPKKQNSYTNDMFVQEIGVQKEVCESIKEAVTGLKDQKEITKKIYRSLDRIYDVQKQNFEKMFQLEQEKVEEMKRHNLFMEKLRLSEVESKIERNRRLLEIEDLKGNIK